MTREEAKDSLFRFIERDMTMKNISFEIAIDAIYDDFESRICENCKYSSVIQGTDRLFCGCDEAEQLPTVNKDFGCNKFERKTDE